MIEHPDGDSGAEERRRKGSATGKSGVRVDFAFIGGMDSSNVWSAAKDTQGRTLGVMDWSQALC